MQNYDLPFQSTKAPKICNPELQILCSAGLLTGVINNPVKFHEAILIGCQVTEGTPLVDYDAKYDIYKLCGHEWNVNSSIFRFKRP